MPTRGRVALAEKAIPKLFATSQSGYQIRIAIHIWSKSDGDVEITLPSLGPYRWWQPTAVEVRHLWQSGRQFLAKATNKPHQAMLVEQCLGFLQVERIEALGEPTSRISQR
jgi:hypothetical protein